MTGFAAGGSVLADPTISPDPGANPPTGLLDPNITNRQRMTLSAADMEKRYGSIPDRARAYAIAQQREREDIAAGPPVRGMVWGIVSNQGPMGTMYGWTWPMSSPQYKPPYQQTQPSYSSYPVFDAATGTYTAGSPGPAPEDGPVFAQGTGGQPLVLGEPSHIVGDQTGTPYAALAEPDPITGASRPEALEITPLNRPEMGGQVPQMPGVQAPRMGQMNRRMIDMEMMRMMVAQTMASLKMPRRVSRNALA